ncbi:HNH endonuclease, partial [Bacillus sp. JJ1773]|uniref:HNH endonuclease n=1 Tax=Bacillus sp. JJ1773 TaxID=3122965 RepID=UPI002FFFB48C
YFYENDDDIKEACIKPNKVSALHYFLLMVYKFNIVNTIKSYLFEDNELENVYEILQEIIDVFKLDISLDKEYFLKYLEENEVDKFLYETIIEDILYDDIVVESFIESAFYILFLDRKFLHDFNLSLSEYVDCNDNFKEDYFEYISRNGNLKRARFPEWLKDAVFHRDKGICVLCRRDLSGIVNSDISKHIDHIIPLNYKGNNRIGGTNDASNFQLLCDICNTTKGSRNTATNLMSIPWWD